MIQKNLRSSPTAKYNERPPTTNDWLVEAIRSAIIFGECEPGQAIRQEDFASRYQVSRMPIREALRTLSAQGWVQLMPNKGAFVVPLDSQDAIELFESRAALEAVAARHSVPQLTQAEKEKLQKAHLRLNTALANEYYDAHKAFHLAIYTAASARLVQLIAQMMDASERYLRFEAKTMQISSADRKEHQTIVDVALTGKVDELEHLLQTHIAQAGRDIAKHLSGQFGKSFKEKI
jgi:DNA-binding GntR family transcriptional regulator